MPRAGNTPSADVLINRSRELLPLLARNAVQSDVDRGIPDENIAALREAGLLGLSVPRRYGGFEAKLRTMLDVTAVLGEACGATAWVVANRHVCSWVAALLPTRAQDEIFGDDPAIGIAGVNAPSATAHRVAGGVKATGKWYYCSGATHASWAMLGLIEKDSSGKLVDQYLALVPIKELSIEDTWYTIGMRGTASNCIVGDDLFIPEHRLFSLLNGLKGAYPREQTDEALYRSTLAAFFPISLAGPLLGLGRAALQYVIGGAADRNITGTTYKVQSESSAFQVQIAEAAMKLHAAELLIANTADAVDNAALQGELMPLNRRTQCRAAAAYAGTQITDAINILMSAHGAGSFSALNPLQRIWRDANISTRHTALLHPVAMEVHGRALLGVEKNIAFLL